MQKITRNFLLNLFFVFFYLLSLYAYCEENNTKKISHANIYIEYGEISKALDILNSIKNRNKNDFKLLLTYGKAYLKIREYEKAKQFFEDAIFTSEFQDDDAYLGISKAYLEIGDFKNAYKYIRPLLKSSYKEVESELILVEIEFRTGYMDEAKKRLLKLYKNRKNDPEVIIAYAKYLFLRKRDKTNGYNNSFC